MHSITNFLLYLKENIVIATVILKQEFSFLHLFAYI